MEKQSTNNRLNFLRYGLIVVVLVTFAVSFGTHYIYIGQLQELPMSASLVYGLIQTIVVAVIMVVVYFVYAMLLNRGEPKE